MTFEVVASPEHENELEEYRFRFRAECLTLEFIRFRRFRRDDETAPWQPFGEWMFPDLHHCSTLPQPELPEWAKLDAKTYINQQLRIKE